MKQSKLFTKTQKFAPKDEVSKNAQLLIRAGFVHKEMAGVYSFLPLGLRVFNNIMNIIREEMNAIGGQELFLTTLQKKELWNKTNRWDDEIVDNWFKTKLKNGTELGLAFTHEEAITAMMKTFITSYKDLPFTAYQFQNKFRNETRAKSGIMRGREFIMKDLYSFSRTIEEHEEFYEKSKKAYTKIFKRLGVGDKTYLTFASGGTFSKYSHEFQTICDAGEDIVYIDKEKGIAINEEVYNEEVLADLKLNKDDLVKEKVAEVGNIFSLGTKFSDAFDLTYKDEKGEEQKVIMGSYGIGPARVMGVIVELLSDEGGIVWPESVAPFKVHLINIGEEEKTEEIYKQLQEAGIEVLWDDRDVRPGEKFADSDLIGIPNRVVVSSRSLEAGGVEFKKRTEKDGEIIAIEELMMRVKK
jgi:prolyl-tRNA synthetase